MVTIVRVAVPLILVAGGVRPEILDRLNRSHINIVTGVHGETVDGLVAAFMDGSAAPPQPFAPGQASPVPAGFGGKPAGQCGNGTVDYGGGPLTSGGSSDVVVAKLGPDGRHIWSRLFESSSNDSPMGIAVDPYIVGARFEEVSSDGQTQATGFRQVVVNVCPLAVADDTVGRDVHVCEPGAAIDGCERDEAGVPDLCP